MSVPSDISGFASFEVGIYTGYGYILYINGEEVLRHNVDEVVAEDAMYHRVALPIDMLPSDAVVIAAEIYYPADHQELTDDFKGFMTFVPKSAMRAFEGTVSSDHPLDYSSQGMENAFDMDRRTTWGVSSLPAYLNYTFDGQRRDFINAYAITSSGGVEARRPYKWVLRGSNDGATWTVLDEREGVVFTAMYQTKRFTLPHNHESFNQYSITFEEAASGTIMEVGLVEFFADDVTYIETPTLEYPSASVELFAGQTDVYIAPTTNGFTSFSTSGTLPTGLTLSEDSGAIFGSVETATSATSITVNAVHVLTGETSYTATISISVVDCTGERRRVRIVKHDGGFGSADLWELKSGETVLDSHYGRDILNSQVAGDEYFEYCLTQGIYTLALSQKYDQGWDLTSYIDVFVYVSDTETMRVLHNTCVYSPSTSEYEFNTYVLSDNDLTQWTYNADGTIPDGWASSDFSGSWSNVPSEAPQVSQSVWLFRRQVTVSTITNLMGFEVMVYHRAGLIFYLNGEEVFRTNVDGTLTGSSTGTNQNSGTAVWTHFTERVGTGHLIAGQNTFALAIVNPDSTQRTIDTLIQIRMLSPMSISLGLETSVTDTHHNNADTVSENMFHGDYNTRYVSTASEEHVVTATFLYGGMHFINMYCMISGWNALENSPSGWTVAVSQDGSIFTDVQTTTEVHFKEMFQRRCFVMPNENSIRAIRFTFNSIQHASDNIQLNILDLFYADPSQFTVPTFSYGEASEHTAYVGGDFSLEPVSMLYYDFSIEPSLPDGMVLESTGIIRGRPTAAADSATYMVSARNLAGVSVSASVLLSVADCSNGHYLASMTMTNTNTYGVRMVILITVSDETLYWNDNIPNYASAFDIAFCVPGGVIKFVLMDRNNEGWQNTYTITAGDETSTGSVDRGETPLTISLAPFYYIEESGATVQFSQQAPEEGWYRRDATRNWEEIALGEMPPISGLTSYYCATFDASSLSDLATFEIAAKVRGGLVMYLNDQEVNRVRVPTDATHETPAEGEFDEAQYISYIDSTQMSVIEETNNLICIEVHELQARPDDDNPFNMYIKPYMGDRDVVVDGEGTCSHVGYYDSSYDERSYHLWNKVTSDKFFSSDSSCTNVWGLWTFNNYRRDYATHGVFYRGNVAYRRAYSVSVQGTNDPESENPTFVELASRSDLTWSSSYEEIDFIPNKPYRAYRAVFNGCNSEGIEIGEILFYANRVEGSVCRPQNGLPGTTEGSYVQGECPELYSGTVSYLCSGGEFVETGRACTASAPTLFEYESSSATAYTRQYFELKATFVGAEVSFTAFPNLPDGLEVDQTTGNIQGTPRAAQETRSFTITCGNGNGSIQARIALTVVETPTPVWVYIVIVVAVIVVIAIIVVVIIVVVKNSKKGKGKGKGKNKSKTLPKTAAAPAPKLKETTASKKIAV